MNFELEKLKLQLELQKISSKEAVVDQPRMDITRVVPRFDPNVDEIGLYLTIFERQLKFLSIPEENWIPYLIGSLPTEIAQLVAREDENDSKDYRKVKEMLLKRYRLTADRFRQLFAQHKKNPDTTWRDFYFEIASYFEGWITELNIQDFDQLKNLIISDQIKKKTPPDVKEHFIDSWSQWNQPLELAEKLDTYENNRHGFKKNPISQNKQNFRSNFLPTDRRFKSTTFREDKHEKTAKNVFSKKTNSTPERRTIQCYGCGTPGYIQSKCPTCLKSKEEVKTSINSVNLFTFDALSSPSSLIVLDICGVRSAVCADTGASHSIAGEKLFHMLKSKQVNFKPKTISMTLADGTQKNVSALITIVDLKVEGKVVPTELIVLPEAKGNRTLLGTDFLQSAGIVLDVLNGNWHFFENPKIQYPFYKVPAKNENSSSNSDSNERIAEISTSVNVPVPSSVDLRSDEGKHLTKEQRTQLNRLLQEFKSCFEPGGEPTPFSEHRINTGNSPPVAEPPYRMNPAKKELLRKELDSLLADDIIEECESPYASPVVLVPKPNGSIRLCVDFRKLNATTIPDTYPLPRMDDLLTEAKSTSYMSTIDLKSGYHQVKVHEADQDKTAFICPFGTVAPLRRRGRPKKFSADSSPRRRASQRGSL